MADLKPQALTRIWGKSGYRVFLSHSSKAKRSAAELKDRLQPFGVSAFVAHQDIKGNKAVAE